MRIRPPFGSCSCRSPPQAGRAAGTMAPSEGSTPVTARTPRMISDDAFRWSALDRPADDGPRLVYADWLEEEGDADRAELIRLQCGGGDPRRERDLIARSGPRWAGPVLGSVYAYTFRRGFV